MRFTTRWLMIVVAVVAVLLSGFKLLAWVLFVIREAIDEPFGAQSVVTRTWDLGPTPDVTVDCFEGMIQVFPSTDGRVSAKVTSFVLAEDFRSAAEAGLRSIDVQLDQRGDGLRIVARGASEPDIRKQAHVELHVPPNVRLDLRTGRGSIWVGWSWSVANNAIVAVPITTASVRARNDSPYRFLESQGDIRIATRAPRARDGTPTPTRLQLDAPGRIEVTADLATVEARAWHGTEPPDPTLPPGAVRASEDGQEGSIRFEGTFGEGAHSLHAAHRVEVHLAALAEVEVVAVARNGAITSTHLPQHIQPLDGVARWTGAIGDHLGAKLRLRTDDGPILILSPP